jgi:hypothetical protein
MRNWIAGAMTVLGTLLVLSGAVTIIMRTWFTPAQAGGSAETFGAVTVAEERERGLKNLLRLSAPDRLIGWGIVLLVLAAVAAGAISFNLGAAAPAK